MNTIAAFITMFAVPILVAIVATTWQITNQIVLFLIWNGLYFAIALIWFYLENEINCKTLKRKTSKTK